MSNQPKDLQKNETKESFIKKTASDTISKTISTILAGGILAIISALIIFLYGLPVWLYLPISAAVFFFICVGLFLYGKFQERNQTNNYKIENEKEETALLESPEYKKLIESNPPPNLVCWGDSDLDVRLDRREIFRETNAYDAPMRAIAVKLQNKTNPPNKVGTINNVKAEIIYYYISFPDHPDLLYHATSACWLNEESPSVSFEVNQIHHLILGVRHCREDSGFEEGFTVYENNTDPSKNLQRYDTGKYVALCLVVVRIIAGNHGEFSAEYEFEIEIDGTSSYTVEYLNEEAKKARNQSYIRQLERFIVEGQRLLNENENTDISYADLRNWQDKIDGFIKKKFGLNLLNRFLGYSEVRNNDKKVSRDKPTRFNEFHSKLSNLEEIVKELKAE